MKFPERPKPTPEILKQVDAASAMYANALMAVCRAKNVTLEQAIHMLVIVVGPEGVKDVIKALGGEIVEIPNPEDKPTAPKGGDHDKQQG